jgi:hypothetical protein
VATAISAVNLALSLGNLAAQRRRPVTSRLRRVDRSSRRPVRSR